MASGRLIRNILDINMMGNSQGRNYCPRGWIVDMLGIFEELDV